MENTDNKRDYTKNPAGSKEILTEEKFDKYIFMHTNALSL